MFKVRSSKFNCAESGCCSLLSPEFCFFLLSHVALAHSCYALGVFLAFSFFFLSFLLTSSFATQAPHSTLLADGCMAVLPLQCPPRRNTARRDNSARDTARGVTTAPATPHVAQRQRSRHHAWRDDSARDTTRGATTALAWCDDRQRPRHHARRDDSDHDTKCGTVCFGLVGIVYTYRLA